MNFWGEDRRRIVGIGSVLIDILINESDEFVAQAGGIKGGMVYVPMEKIDELTEQASEKPVLAPGGSACNTVIGVGHLGGKAGFVGKGGDDDMAAFFSERLKAAGVTPQLLTAASGTGRVASIITPDAQRSMLTCLGASAEITADEISPEMFEGAAIVHVEGYLVFNQALITAVMQSARSVGARISLDLASFTVVEESGEFLRNLVAEYVDILLANEDEAAAFTGLSDEPVALDALAKSADLAVLKVGSRGSHICCGHQRIRVEPVGAGSAIDTTGAGDLWASGFLYGLVSGLSLETAGHIGSICGYEVCQVHGAAIPEEGWDKIRRAL